MNPKNDFKAFSINNNANVVSQERYEESKDLLTGFPPNDAPTYLLNKVLRQSSTISSVVADFIATQSGNDVLDDGNIAKLTAQLDKALEQKITAGIPGASLTQKGITQLTDVTGNRNTLAATQKLVTDVNDNANSKLAKNQNGADIPDKNAFVKNLSLLETVQKANNAVPSSRKVNGKALTGDINFNAGDIDTYTKAEVNNLINAVNNIPVGVPMPWPTAIPPTGWLQCNGAAFDKSKFPELAKAYPDGNLPDLRGEFIRGWDDGRGVDKDRKLNSNQRCMTEYHKHMTAWGESVNYDGFGIFGATNQKNHSGNTGAMDRDNFWYHTNDGSDYEGIVNSPGVMGSETRPRNVAFNYIVRAA
ncbi:MULTISPECIES: tail fiber protein [Photorhabdus]|uniref:tail fiber protein n=1 Tax=Photorhabdus TaxID=29487 RepID=UPI000DCCF00C|nr:MULTISPECIES: tail fiber protein [Photorhabdus]MCT8345113.1 tail fiber protein [Photorhabdus kleinii]RAW96109.1 phage tail protein [Photorhabdus sp. S9-53]RAW96176.1 phage tail protein [Photorhabdus sp. S10-54]RAX00236.1 phage tail protein [Photorhabdus sp. S8-52]